MTVRNGAHGYRLIGWRAELAGGRGYVLDQQESPMARYQPSQSKGAYASGSVSGLAV